MLTAGTIVETGRRLREMAGCYATDLNEIYFLAHVALEHLVDSQSHWPAGAPSRSALTEALRAAMTRIVATPPPS